VGRGPEKLARRVETRSRVEDRNDRIELLIDLAARFRPVPEGIGSRPYPEERKVPGCESEVYLWTTENADGTLDYHFAVENPQGISAKALAAVLSETLSGAPLHEGAEVDPELAHALFGQELSMGKSLGLTGMVAMVRAAARRHLAARSGVSSENERV